MHLEGLFDLYGVLLTAKQQDVFKLHYHDDLSMGEISERLAISRPAVADHLRRAEEFLEHTEISLGLSKRLQDIDNKIKAAIKLLVTTKGMTDAHKVTLQVEAAIDKLRDI